MTGDRTEALQQAKLAQDIGGRLGDQRFRRSGSRQQGYALVAMGRIDDGMALIDESTVAAVSGELDPMTTGKIYCSTISVCRDLSDWRRAVEWTDAAERWCDRQKISGFPESAACTVPKSCTSGAPGPTRNGKPDAPARSSAGTTLAWRARPATRSVRFGSGG